MKFITILYFIAKAFFLVMTFLVVKSQADYFYVPLLNNLGIMIAGILSLFIIHKNYKIKIFFPTWKEIIKEIKEGFNFFISTISTNAYTNSGPFILGLFANEIFVGYYSAAERLIRAVQRILWAASQSIYPYINRLVSQSKEQGLRFIKRLMLVFNGGFFLISLFIFIFAKTIINIIFGPNYQESYSVLLILSFLPFIISLSNIFGIQTMLSFGMIRAYSRIMLGAMILNVSLSIIMAFLYRHIGIAWAVVMTEIFITLAAFLYLRKKQIKFEIARYFAG